MRRKVKDVMTGGVVVVGELTPFKMIVGLLEEHRISAVPVVDGKGVVIGVVSEADLLTKERYPHGRGDVGAVAGLRHRAELRKAEGVTAAELMSSPPVTVLRSTTVAEAARIAAAAGVKRLPVVDDAGRPVGIVSRSDLLKVFLRPDDDIHREIAGLVHPAVWADPSTVEVAVADGVVTLRGHVHRRSSMELLARMAEAVDGVVSVELRLGWDVDDTALPPVSGVPLGY